MLKNIDTNNVIEMTTKISKNCEQVEYEFNKLFDILENIPTETKEWTGDAAKKYFSLVGQDRDKYLSFVKSIKEINNEIIYQADRIAEVTAKNKELL